MILSAMILFVGVAGYAQSGGEAIYKAKCLNCHGPAGVPVSGIGKLMKVKPVTDPAVMKLTDAEMIEMVRKGVGKMQPYKDSLSDAQIKETVAYFRAFLNK
jgi:mono/diheme cytochrome c family protein